jgi:RecB family endonuclease NucS
MYRINQQTNSIQKIEETTFKEIGATERYHLQEWIAKNPEVLCGEDEKLLIIQKEFAGFSDTKERLDLLALDQDGNLVIIENKLDDSGRDVTWKGLNYVSYFVYLS